MLLIFEMANNHGGSVAKGLQIIDEFAAVKEKFPQFEYAFKFQYRDLPSYIHPDADEDHPYVKRFRETYLSLRGRHKLKHHAKDLGFLTAFTPFDEQSVRDGYDHDYDILKIGSPCMYDPNLLTEIHFGWHSNRPIIMSVGGATEQEIDFAIFTLAREDVTLMHCQSEYPTRYPNIGQIGWLSQTYPNNKVGFSSHQDPEEYIYLPYAHAYEFHVCTPPAPNKYSLNAEQAKHVLARLVVEFLERDPGPKPTQFMRRKERGDVLGRWWWKPSVK